MRVLISTVAAAAITAMPGFAQTPTDETTETPEAEATTEMAAGASQGESTDTRELQGAEIYRATYQGQQALVVITDAPLDTGTAPGGASLGAATTMPETPVSDAAPDDDVRPDLTEDPTAAVPEDVEGEALETTSSIPETEEGDVVPEEAEAAAGAETGEVPEDAPEIALDSGEAGVDTGVAEQGSGAAGDALSTAGLTDAQQASDTRVFRTTAGDGRTVLIIVGADF